jgi:hypothetical protein
MKLLMVNRLIMEEDSVMDIDCNVYPSYTMIIIISYIFSIFKLLGSKCHYLQTFDILHR